MKILAIGKIIYKRRPDSKNIIYILEDGSYLIKHMQLVEASRDTYPESEILKVFKNMMLIESEYRLSEASVEMLHYALKERKFLTNKIIKYPLK